MDCDLLMRAVRDPRLKRSEVCLLIALSDCPAREDGWITIGRHDLAAKACVSASAAAAALTRLSDAGWLERHAPIDAAGRNLATQYRINHYVIPPLGDRETDTGGQHPAPLVLPMDPHPPA